MASTREQHGAAQTLEACAALDAKRKIGRYSDLAWKVLQALTFPLSMPRLNQRTRCAELPCVNESGTI